jgi:hypothetical protein
MKLTPEQQAEALKQILAARQAAANLFEQIELMENPPQKRRSTWWKWLLAALLLIGNLYWWWAKW